MGIGGGKRETVVYKRLPRRFNSKYDAWDLHQNNPLGIKYWPSVEIARVFMVLFFLFSSMFEIFQNERFFKKFLSL